MAEIKKERKPKNFKFPVMGFLMGKTIEIYAEDGNILFFTVIHNGKTRVGRVGREHVEIIAGSK